MDGYGTGFLFGVTLANVIWLIMTGLADSGVI